MPKIRDHVDVLPQPAVVRLEHLQSPEAGWVSESYYVTQEIEAHLSAMRTLLAKDTGCGVFLIGHYGCGKSHFLAYLTQQVRNKTFAARNPVVLPVSLLNYKASGSLESILEQELQVTPGADRRQTWNKVARRYPAGLLIVLDELSEFLRSKPAGPDFNEDLRFLQFLGEWAQSRPLWILGALQEQIEHTGEIEYDLFRKIRDRYPIRLLLTAGHVRDLIEHRILRKKPSYEAAVETLVSDFRAIYPDAVDYAELRRTYPLHPATLELLEEVRDRFSQTRGVIDFTLTQLLGNEARAVAPFLEQPWGRLLTPDAIVDHFADLFEIQPQFLPIAQKVLPFYRKHLPELFESKIQRELADALLKLLILVHLSPRREYLQADDAARWLMLKVSTIDPDKNRQVAGKVLDTLAARGSYVKQDRSRYRLDLEDDSKQYLEQLLARTVDDLRRHGDSVFESLVPLLRDSDFDLFSSPRDRWHMRKVRWHFHDWNIQFYFGGGRPADVDGPSLQLGLPWGTAPDGHCYRVLPAQLEATFEVLELAALQQLKQRPLPARVMARVEQRISARAPWFRSLVQNTYAEAALADRAGNTALPAVHSVRGGHVAWLNSIGEWILRQTYPAFERYAPGSGPLSHESYRQLMRFSAEHDICAQDAPEAVKLIREAYLVPMGLMQRRGAEYAVPAKLDSNELVRYLAQILGHHPSPARVYEHLSAPVYGLVPDQIHLLLIVLLLQGEVDIVKGEHSYRESFETLVSPLQYDRILPGQALTLDQVRKLQSLCEAFRISVPKQWSVIAQKRAVEQLRKTGRAQRDLLSEFALKLKAAGDEGVLVPAIEALISQWLALEKGQHELQGFEHFEHAIGPVDQFATTAAEMALLPQRFERLLRETQRFRHLLGDPALSRCTAPQILTSVQAVGAPPSLAHPDEVDSWLRRAQEAYQTYTDWYRTRHQQWSDSVARHPIWSYRIPPVARSRHVALSARAAELERVISEAGERRCRGLTALDFQPLCRCGFDGAESPLNSTLATFEAASQQLARALELFFQQDKVKARVREWADRGLEFNTTTLSYLQNKGAYPEISDLALFDQHLSGLELVHTVESDALLDVLGDRTWDKYSLMAALDQFFERAGPRIALRRHATAPRRDLVAWCYEQALATGRALPAVFSRDEQKAAAELIEPEWIGAAGLCRLEEIGLGEESVLRVLELVLDGRLKLHTPLPDTGPIGAALDLMHPRVPATPAELATRVQHLYVQHARFMKLRPRQWLDHLDRLAWGLPAESVAPLQAVLAAHLDAQWIVVDCLGLPLLNAVGSVLAEVLPHRGRRQVQFALVPAPASTNSFYASMLTQEFSKPFDKVNVVDALVHERRPDLAELERLARAELGISLQRISGRLDASKPLLVFGDNGFRLAADGRAFSHGGASTLERTTAVFLMA